MGRLVGDYVEPHGPQTASGYKEYNKYAPGAQAAAEQKKTPGLSAIQQKTWLQWRKKQQQEQARGGAGGDIALGVAPRVGKPAPPGTPNGAEALGAVRVLQHVARVERDSHFAAEKAFPRRGRRGDDVITTVAAGGARGAAEAVQGILYLTVEPCTLYLVPHGCTLYLTYLTVVPHGL